MSKTGSNVCPWYIAVLYIAYKCVICGSNVSLLLFQADQLREMAKVIIAEPHFSIHKFNDQVENVSREKLGDQLSEEKSSG